MHKLKLYNVIILIVLLILTAYSIIKKDTIIDIYSGSFISKDSLEYKERSTEFKKYEQTNKELRHNFTDKTEDEKLKFVINNIINDSMPEYDKVKTIHDYLVSVLSYDDESVRNNTVTDSANQPGVVLITNKAVCAGYSYTFNKMCQLIGIDSNTIIGYILQNGKNIKHAWNQVLINNEWYNVDVTFDDPCDSGENVIFYNYFMVSDETLGNRTDIHAHVGELHDCNSTLYEYKNSPISVDIYK